jgi:hypothetical protein
MPTMSRRELVLSGASLAILASTVPLGALSGEQVSVDAFRALSARLTGASLADLDASAAAELLAGFVSRGLGAEIARLAADSSARGGRVVNDIVAAWYSGSYATSAGLASFGLTRALLWNALDYTKPPGLCGGTIGYWADPPAR